MGEEEPDAVCMYVCMYVRTYEWMDVGMYVCMYVRVRKEEGGDFQIKTIWISYIYTHTYIHPSIHPSIYPSIHTLVLFDDKGCMGQISL